MFFLKVAIARSQRLSLLLISRVKHTYTQIEARAGRPLFPDANFQFKYLSTQNI